MRAERQAEASSREIVTQREEFAKREADLEDQLERLSQDVAKVSQTSEERARALVTFERRAVAAENDHERLSEMVARLETSLAAETKRAERAEDDGEYERMKEQLEIANGEMQKLRKEVDVTKRRAEIAERDLKVRVGVLNGGRDTTNGGENIDGLAQEDRNELESLRKRSEEMTKLLYEKQRQLESLQGEKQTWSMRLERAKEEVMNSAETDGSEKWLPKRGKV
jgi:chromosome segregation ATPase